MKLEIQFDSFEDLAAFAARNVGENVSAPPKTPATPKKASLNEKLAVKAAKEAEPADEDELTDTGDEEAADEQPSYEDVKAALLKVNKLKGKNAAISILKKYGASKVGPELKEKDYAAFLTDCEKALA